MSPQTTSAAGGSSRQVEHTSALLLARARLGDSIALGRLLSRYLLQLRRWAHGRLPQWARTTCDTTDLIHDAVLRTIGRLEDFEARGTRAIAAYLRQAVQNRIRDEHRRVARRGVPAVLSEEFVDSAPSPLDIAMRSEMEARYRLALGRLSERDRELIVAHVELDYSHEQLGCISGQSANAARMALQRAVRRLAEQMRDG